ncbi:hypothetical protein VNO80_32180 [Phaseolus coccineus]|uniref:Uncharacterized protein n=1 Tax=Phaseolus coccineus TaxID=3886 RepID=A0AAN9Q9P9_PHACN
MTPPSEFFRIVRHIKKGIDQLLKKKTTITHYIRRGSKLLLLEKSYILYLYGGSANQMIFLFQFLSLLLPLNHTFPCHNNGEFAISINDRSRILDV